MKNANIYRPSGRNRTCGPVIPVQRSNWKFPYYYCMNFKSAMLKVYILIFIIYFFNFSNSFFC